MSPDNWKSKTNGLGSCFHQALHRWALLHAHGEHGYRIAIGVVGKSAFCLERHLHAWLENGAEVVSAVSGKRFPRLLFYRRAGIEPDSVRLVKPRAIIRKHRGYIDSDTVISLLNAAQIPWREDRGGIIPV
jgi:hypothetical protein